jgi:lipoteichoic acid synthase
MGKAKALFLKRIDRIKIKKYIKRNTLFLTTVVSLLINATLLRFFTVRNFFELKPIVADLSIVLLICAFAYLIRPKKQIVYFMTISIVLSAICLINSIYYTFYNSFTSVSLIATSLQVKDVSDAVVKNVLQLKDFIFLFQPFVVYFIHINLIKKHYYTSHLIDSGKRLMFRTLTTAVIIFVIFFISLTPVEVSRLVKQWNREFLVMKVGLYTYQINDIIRSLEPRINRLFGYDEVARRVNYYYSDRDLKLTKNKYTDIFKGKNIITIHAESIQTFTMDLEFNNMELTPNLNSLANQGLNFTNFYTQVGVGTSSDTEFTFNTSLMPVNSGTVFVSYWDREYITTPKLLKEQGYYSFSMHGNNGTFWNRLVMHREMGYNRMFHKNDYIIDEEIGLGLSDRSFFRQSIPKIQEISEQYERFYGTMIMLTNHTPFDEIEKYGNFPVDMTITIQNEDGIEETVTLPYMEGTRLGNYLKAVHYVDLAIGEFIEGLDEAGLLDNTVIIIYGDHDARLPRKDYVRMYNYDPNTDSVLDNSHPDYIPFDYYAYELNRKVPFIIWSKDFNKPKKIEKVMGMIDVLPTLGNMFGFHSPYQLGNDIFSVEENVVSFTNGNWLTNKMYYNSQRQEYLLLKEDIVSQDYIEKYTRITEDILQISNYIIIYDYIRRQREIEILMQNYKG